MQSRLLAFALMATSVLGFLQRQVRPSFPKVTRVNLFDKLFEEEGTLGKGITVGRVQVALNSPDRSDNSIFALLEDCATDTGNEPEELSRMANDVCLALMRKSDDWIAACSTSQWFKGDDAGKAESYYNELANNEAMKFEKEYIPDEDDDGKAGSSTICLQDLKWPTNFRFDGAGYSLAQTNEVLSSIASDCLVDDGYCVNAVEVLWTPSDKDEVLSKNDMIIDFPELIDL
eukprot:scaffold1736_cov127-Cylindrotheca_fusiformis.AAC.61